MDSPWSRLPFTIPGALAFTTALLLALVRLLSLGSTVPAPTPTLDARLVELEPSSPQAAAPASPPPEPRPATPVPRPRARQRPRAEPPQAQPDATPAAEAPSTSSASAESPRPARAAPAGGNMSARALYRPLPQIPDDLRHQSVELAAVARFRVAEDGTAQVELVDPTPEPTLNASLLATLRTWRFFPALENGRPVASTIDVRIPISVR